MNLLVIDKTAALTHSRKKWRLMAGKPDVSLCLMAPSRWIEHYKPHEFEPEHDQPYRVFTGPVAFPGYENRAFYCRGLSRAIRKSRPDVILLMEEPYSFFAYQTLHVKKRLAPGAKVIGFTWDNLTYDFRHRYRPSRLYRFIDRRNLGLIDSMLCADEEAARVLESKGFHGLIKSIGYGVDVERFSSKVSFPGEGFTIGYVGRLLRSKGVEDLLHALPGLPETVHLIIVGDGPDEAIFRRLAGHLGLNNRVTFDGGVSPDRMPGMYARFDCLILPSRTVWNWKEQFGRVLIEAMAAGMPVIGSDSGAIPEIIGDAGLIFPEKNTEQLRACISRLIAEPDFRGQLIASGKKRAEEFSLEGFVQKLFNECRAVVGAVRPAADGIDEPPLQSIN